MVKYHLVYKTTNLLNGKFYIGKHSTTNVEDDYLGSGKSLISAVSKYGRHNFKKEILFFANDEKSAYESEYIILSEYIDSVNCYNIKDGGEGFTCRISSLAGKIGATVNRNNGTGMFSWSYGDRSLWSKEHNSNRIWVTDGKTDKRIKLSDYTDELVIGRTNLDMSSRNGLLCWTDGKDNKFSYTSPGEEYRNGMVKETPTAKRPWWTNGIVNKRSEICPEGFVSGRLKWKSKIVSCPHCKKEGGETAMKQHHFEHCKWRKE